MNLNFIKMKALLIGFVLMCGAMLASCGNTTKTVEPADSTKVDSVMVDTMAVDSAVVDTLALDSVQ